jgi:predicted transcriptional regulator
MGKKMSEIETKRRIYNFILKNPGLHMRELSRKMNIPYSTLKYHLYYLKNRELIIVRPSGKYYRFFVSNKNSVIEILPFFCLK